MKKTNNWGINFPDNPYEGQIFYYPRTQDTFTYVVPKNQSGSGQWGYGYLSGLYFKPQLTHLFLPYLEILLPFP